MAKQKKKSVPVKVYAGLTVDELRKIINNPKIPGNAPVACEHLIQNWIGPEDFGGFETTYVDTAECKKKDNTKVFVLR